MTTQKTIQQLSFKEAGEVDRALFEVTQHRALTMGKETKHSINEGVCPMIEEGCLCVRNQEIYEKVCNGDYHLCPKSSEVQSIVMREELLKYADRVQ